MSKHIIANAISAVLVMGFTSTPVLADNTMDMPQMMGNIKGLEKCYGIAKAGHNDCGSVNHGCAGEAKVAGDKSEWLLVPTGLCSKIAGGSTQAPTKS